MPASTRISVKLKRFQDHSSAVHVCVHCRVGAELLELTTKPAAKPPSKVAPQNAIADVN